MNRLRFGYRRTRRGFGLCQTKDLRQKTTEGFASPTADNGEASQVLRQTKDLGQKTKGNQTLVLRQKKYFLYLYTNQTLDVLWTRCLVVFKEKTVVGSLLSVVLKNPFVLWF